MNEAVETNATIEQHSAARRARTWYQPRVWGLGLIIAGLLGGQALTTRRLFETERELAELRQRDPPLVVDDATQLHSLRLPTTDRLSWRWKVHIPSGGTYTDYHTHRHIPASGVPYKNRFHDGGSLGLSPGESTIAMRACRNPLGDWEWLLTIDTSGGRSHAWSRRPLTDTELEWIAQANAERPDCDPVGTKRVVPPGEPLVLLRLLLEDDPWPGGETPWPDNPPLDPNDPLRSGLLIWISDFPPEVPKAPGSAAS